MKKNMYKWLSVFALLLLVCLQVSAQQRKITGTVKDATGAMPGANVIVKGTTMGTVTDSNGQFAIDASPDDVLTVSFIGYGNQDIKVGEQTNIEVVLTEDLQTLDEVVVIGYGEVKRTDVTGSISSVKGEELKRTNATTLEQALQQRQ